MGHTYCQVHVFEDCFSFHRNCLNPFKCNISKTLTWQRKLVLEPSNFMSTMVFLVGALSTVEHNALYQVIPACEQSRSTVKKQLISDNVIRQMLGKC